MASRWRRLWTLHRWGGLALLLPLLWWVLTGLVFILRPMAEIRGTAFRTKAAAGGPRVPLPAVGLPAALGRGAHRVDFRVTAGHPVAVIHREAGTEVWDLSQGRSLGPVLPEAWALELVRLDLADPVPPVRAVLHTTAAPAEYAGPLPAWAVHLADGRETHVYLDALTGEVRAHRNRYWRFYDLCFRLHSLEVTGETSRRWIMLAVGLGWIALGLSGTLMAWRRMRAKAAVS